MIEVYTIRKSVRENALKELLKLSKTLKSVKVLNYQKNEQAMPVIL